METARSRKYVCSKAPDPVPSFVGDTGVLSDDGATGVTGAIT
jgi:hypothetical protein